MDDASPAPLPEPRYPAKIATADDALARIRALPRPLVFTNGVFDVLHRGHVTYLARDRKSTRLNSSHTQKSRMPSSA